MDPNHGTDIASDIRRQLIASMLVRNPRISRRQLQAMLAGPENKGGMRNPRTGKPYGLSTIQKDVDYIRAEWQSLRVQSMDVWVAHELALYEELEMQAWRDNNLSEVRLISAARRKLLGIDAPERQEITGVDGGPIVIQWPD